MRVPRKLKKKRNKKREEWLEAYVEAFKSVPKMNYEISQEKMNRMLDLLTSKDTK